MCYEVVFPLEVKFLIFPSLPTASVDHILSTRFECSFTTFPLVSSVISVWNHLLILSHFLKTSMTQFTVRRFSRWSKNYTLNEWRRLKNTLETSVFEFGTPPVTPLVRIRDPLTITLTTIQKMLYKSETTLETSEEDVKWGKFKTTPEPSVEDLKPHSNWVEKIQNHTRNEWRRFQSHPTLDQFGYLPTHRLIKMRNFYREEAWETSVHWYLLHSFRL